MGDSCFVLWVRGDSISGRGAHILHGDMVVVRAEWAAGASDVTALLDEAEATVKWHHRGGRAGTGLLTAVDSCQPVLARSARIFGEVVAVLPGVWRSPVRQLL